MKKLLLMWRSSCSRPVARRSRTRLRRPRPPARWPLRPTPVWAECRMTAPRRPTPPWPGTPPRTKRPRSRRFDRAPGCARGSKCFRHPARLLRTAAAPPSPRDRPPRRRCPARSPVARSPGLRVRPSTVKVERTVPTSLLPGQHAPPPVGSALVGYRQETREARDWCDRESGGGRPSPVRCSSPWCRIPPRSRRSALPGAGSSRRSRRPGWASRPGCGRRGGRPRRRGAPPRVEAGGPRSRPPPRRASDQWRRTARTSGASATRRGASLHHPPRGIGGADAGLGQRVETVVAQDPDDGRPIGRIVRQGEPGGETALEDGLAPTRGRPPARPA